MIVINKTCIHCGCTYGYHLSGWHCGDKDNDKRFCPDCMQVINEALSKVPKKIEPREKEIEVSEEIIKKLETIKEKCDKEEEELKKKNGWLSGFPGFKRYFYDKYEVVESYYDDRGYKYLVKWNKSTPEDKHYFQLYEWNLLENKFEDLYVDYSRDKIIVNNYRIEYSTKPRKFFAKDEVPVIPLDPPHSEVFFMDVIENPLPLSEKRTISDSSIDELNDYMVEYRRKIYKDIFKING